MVGFGLCLALTAGMLWAALGRMDALHRESARYYHDYMAADAANMARVDLITVRQTLQEVAVNAPIPDAADLLQRSLTDLHRDANLLQRRTANATAHATAKTLLANTISLDNGSARILRLAHDNKCAEATRLWKQEMEPLIKRGLDSLDNYSGPAMTQVEMRHEVSGTLYAEGQRILARLFGFTFCLVGLLAVILIRTIKRGLDQTTRRLESLGQELPRLVQATEALAAGYRSAPVVIETPPLQWEYQDEFGALAASLNQCIAQTQQAATVCADTLQFQEKEALSSPMARMAA